MSPEAARLAVVTGGHPFDVIGFQSLVRAACGDQLVPYVQHLDDFSSSPPEVIERYDAALFYFFPLAGPADDGVAGQAGRPRAAIEGLLRSGAGVVVLHHALLAYPQWDTWDQVVGCRGRSHFTYHPGREVQVGIADPAHALCRGIDAWTMVDETYRMPEPDGIPLLVTGHPESMRTLGWSRHHGRSRVVCLQPGHDAGAWSVPGYQRILTRSLRWAAAGRERV